MPLIEVTSAVLELYLCILHTYLNTLHRFLTQLGEWAVRSLAKAATHVCADPWVGGFAALGLLPEKCWRHLSPDLTLLTSVQTGNPDWQSRLLPIPDFHYWTSSVINSEVYVYIQVHVPEYGFSHKKWKDLHVCMCLCVWKVKAGAAGWVCKWGL